MTGQTLHLNEALQSYLDDHALREPAACRSLRNQILARKDANLASAPEQVQLLALLANLLGAQRIIEVGTYAGYTTLWLALALPDTARILTLEQDSDIAGVARQAWTEAGVEERISLEQGDALESLGTLFDSEEEGASRWDMAYIDADKENLLAYYEACLRLVRPGGLIAVDNTLWQGQVADPDINDDATHAIRAFNDRVHADERVEPCLVPIGDGLTLARRIS